MKTVLVTCMVLFAAISSSFAYGEIIYPITLSAPGSETVFVPVSTTTGIGFYCFWSPLSGISDWYGTGYCSISNNTGQLIDDYDFNGLQNNSAPYYNNFTAGTFSTLSLYLEAGPGTWGGAQVWW